jgi:hypothetical protein
MTNTIRYLRAYKTRWRLLSPEIKLSLTSWSHLQYLYSCCLLSNKRACISTIHTWLMFHDHFVMKLRFDLTKFMTRRMTPTTVMKVVASLRLSPWNHLLDINLSWRWYILLMSCLSSSMFSPKNSFQKVYSLTRFYSEKEFLLSFWSFVEDTSDKKTCLSSIKREPINISWPWFTFHPTVSFVVREQEFLVCESLEWLSLTQWVSLLHLRQDSYTTRLLRVLFRLVYQMYVCRLKPVKPGNKTFHGCIFPFFCEHLPLNLASVLVMHFFLSNL